MYVDKKLGEVNAVQTLSRLNRTHPGKSGTMVLDFANEAHEIKAAFEPYYEATLLSEATDPNLLYDIQTRLATFPVYTQADIDRFAKAYFDSPGTQDRLYAALAPVVQRFHDLPDEQERHGFRRQLTSYIRLYAFLAQVLTFADAELEKLYVFARHLRRLLPAERAELPREIQQNIDMESYRIQQTRTGRIALDRKVGVLDPITDDGRRTPPAEELEPLSRIIAELNERFGLNLGPEHRVTLGQKPPLPHAAAVTYELLTRLAEFDRRESRAGSGFRSCAHWLSWRTGIAPGAARKKVRVARARASLPRAARPRGGSRARARARRGRGGALRPHARARTRPGWPRSRRAAPAPRRRNRARRRGGTRRRTRNARRGPLPGRHPRRCRRASHRLRGGPVRARGGSPRFRGNVAPHRVRRRLRHDVPRCGRHGRGHGPPNTHRRPRSPRLPASRPALPRPRLRDALPRHPPRRALAGRRRPPRPSRRR